MFDFPAITTAFVAPTASDAEALARKAADSQLQAWGLDPRLSALITGAPQQQAAPPPAVAPNPSPTAAVPPQDKGAASGLRAFWDRYRRAILISLGALAVLVVGVKLLGGRRRRK